MTPEKTKLHILAQEQWPAFEKLFDLKSCSGVYFPKTYDAFIKNNQNQDELLNVCAHEYVGHGLFYEYNTLGRYLADQDNMFSELEKELYGREVSDSDNFIVFKGEERSLVPLDKQGGYTHAAIIINQETFQIYTNTRDNHLKFKQYYVHISEELADMITQKIGEKIKCN